MHNYKAKNLKRLPIFSWVRRRVSQRLRCIAGAALCEYSLLLSVFALALVTSTQYVSTSVGNVTNHAANTLYAMEGCGTNTSMDGTSNDGCIADDCDQTASSSTGDSSGDSTRGEGYQSGTLDDDQGNMGDPSSGEDPVP